MNDLVQPETEAWRASLESLDDARLRAVAENYMVEATASKQAALETLIRLGTHSADGELTKPYR